MTSYLQTALQSHDGSTGNLSNGNPGSQMSDHQSSEEDSVQMNAGGNSQVAYMNHNISDHDSSLDEVKLLEEVPDSTGTPYVQNNSSQWPQRMQNSTNYQTSGQTAHTTKLMHQQVNQSHLRAQLQGNGQPVVISQGLPSHGNNIPDQRLQQQQQYQNQQHIQQRQVEVQQQHQVQQQQVQQQVVMQRIPQTTQIAGPGQRVALQSGANQSEASLLRPQQQQTYVLQQQQKLRQQQLQAVKTSDNDPSSDAKIRQILQQAGVQIEQQKSVATSVTSQCVTPAANIQLRTVQSNARMGTPVMSTGSPAEIRNASPTKTLLVVRQPSGQLSNNYVMTDQARQKLQGQLQNRLLRPNRPGTQQVVAQGQRQVLLAQRPGQSAQTVGQAGNQPPQWPGYQQQQLQQRAVNSQMHQQQQRQAQAQQQQVQQHQHQQVQQQQMLTQQGQRLVQGQHGQVLIQQLPQGQQMQQQLTPGQQIHQTQQGQQQGVQSQLRHVQRMQLAQGQQMQLTQGQQVQLAQGQQVQLAQGQQLSQGQQRQVQVMLADGNSGGASTNAQFVTSQGQPVLHLSEAGKQILRSANPGVQNQIAYNRNFHVNHPQNVSYRLATPGQQQIRQTAQFTGNGPGSVKYVPYLGQQQQVSLLQNQPGQSVVESENSDSHLGKKKRMSIVSPTLHQIISQASSSGAPRRGSPQQQQQVTLGSQAPGSMSHPRFLGNSAVINNQGGTCVVTTDPAASYHAGQPAGGGALAQIRMAYGGNQSNSRNNQAVRHVNAGSAGGRQVTAAEDGMSVSIRPQMAPRTVLAAPDDDSPPGTPVSASRAQPPIIVEWVQGPGAKEQIHQRLHGLPPGRDVVLRYHDGREICCIWNGKTISMPKAAATQAAPLVKSEENATAELQRVQQGAEPGSQQMHQMPQGQHHQELVAPNQGRPLHPEDSKQEETPKTAVKKRPQKPPEKGKFALCKNCGMESQDYNRCEGCNKEMPEEPKYIYKEDYQPPKKAKLDLEDPDEATDPSKTIVISNKTILDTKMFYANARAPMHITVTEGGGKPTKRLGTRSPLLPRVVAKNKKKVVKKNAEPEVVAILSSDEEDPSNSSGVADNSLQQPSPSGSRAGTPQPKVHRRYRMEDKNGNTAQQIAKAKEPKEVYFPTFVEMDDVAEVQRVDADCKTKWNWDWLETEVFIEFTGGRRKHCIRDAMRKTNKQGEAYCILCKKSLNYGGRGKSTLNEHCRSQLHVGNVFLDWQESGMDAVDDTNMSTEEIQQEPTSSDMVESSPKSKAGKKTPKKSQKSVFTVQYKGSLCEAEMQLDVRLVRIGSLKGKPFDYCTVNRNGFLFKIQHGQGVSVEINIEARDVDRLLAYLKGEQPTLFVYTTPSCAGKIRNLLNMKSDEGPYFDPTSKVESHKRVIFEMHPSGEIALERQFFNICKAMQVQKFSETRAEAGGETGMPGKESFLVKLDQKSAAMMLREATSGEIGDIREPVQCMITQADGTQVAVPATPTADGHVSLMFNGSRIVLRDFRFHSNSDEEDDELMDRSRSPSPPHAVFSGPIVRLFIYPPPPQTGGIPLSNEDYFCLNDGEFVNDVIIDFYLKYIFLDLLSEEDRQRTHIFSSFFYRRLTQRAKKGEDNAGLTPQERRHSRVKTWTRHTDIFKKDFIIVPINESAHWYLTIICFPGLQEPEMWTTPPPKQQVMSEASLAEEGELPADNSTKEPSDTSTTTDQNTTEDSAAPEAAESSTNGASSQQLPVKTEKELLDEAEEESKEEENMETEDVPDSAAENSTGVHYGWKKRPCILVFDSLSGPSRNAVVRTLREYVQVEWNVKKAATEGERNFDKDYIKGNSVKCPQQTNFSDCGVYVLQYVESFYQMPIVNYSLPMKALEHWFPDDYVKAKRERLRSLIIELQKKLNPSLNYDFSQDTLVHINPS